MRDNAHFCFQAGTPHSTAVYKICNQKEIFVQKLYFFLLFAILVSLLTGMRFHFHISACRIVKLRKQA